MSTEKDHFAVVTGDHEVFDKERADWINQHWAGTNIDAKKVFTFNQTGNMLISTTTKVTDLGKPLQENVMPENVRKQFEQVATFCAAHTKALYCTPTGDRTPEGEPIMYSIYDTDAIRRSIDRSGLWVQVAQAEFEHEVVTEEGNISQELIVDVMGLGTGGGTAALAMARAIGSHAAKSQKSNDGWFTISFRHEKKSSTVSTLLFVCENIFGMAHNSLMVITVDRKEVARHWSVGACTKGSASSISMTMTKDTYMWVDPESIIENARPILKAMENRDEMRIVNHLSHFIAERVYGKDAFLPDAMAITDSLDLIMLRFALRLQVKRNLWETENPGKKLPGEMTADDLKEPEYAGWDWEEGELVLSPEQEDKWGSMDTIRLWPKAVLTSWNGEALTDAYQKVQFAIHKRSSYDGAWGDWWHTEQDYTGRKNFIDAVIKDESANITKRQKLRRGIENARTLMQKDILCEKDQQKMAMAGPVFESSPSSDEKAKKILTSLEGAKGANKTTPANNLLAATIHDHRANERTLATMLGVEESH